MKNFTRWRCRKNLLKTNIKTMISPLLKRPQACQGYQKIQETKMYSNLRRLSPNWIKFEKPSENRHFWWFVFSILAIRFKIWNSYLENFLKTITVKSLPTLKTLCTYRHLVRLFWNQVLTWASVILRFFANVALSVDAKYFCLWNRFSSSQIWSRENEVRGFFLFGGVRFW